MPRRVSGQQAPRNGSSRPTKRKQSRNAALNALETAERQNHDPVKIRQHRLGVVEGDSDGPDHQVDTEMRSRKRRRITTEQSGRDNKEEEEAEQEEDEEEGSDLEGGTWHTGVHADDDDSDLDSDEAFGESDEENFADFTFRGSSTNKPGPKAVRTDKVKEINLDEEDAEERIDGSQNSDGESDGLGDEALDLAAAWDMDDADQQETVANAGKSTTRKNRGSHQSAAGTEGSDISSEEDSESSEDDDQSSQLSISEDDLAGDAGGLQDFIKGIAPTKPEQAGQPLTAALPALPHTPSRFGLPPSKLSAADLLQHVKDPTQRQSIKILQQAEDAGPEAHKGGIPGKLSAPLAKRQQDRLDRAAAYEKSKATLDRWIDTVKQNRRADHLSFPLADPAKESAPGRKQLMSTSQSAPMTDLEAKINEIMRESGMGTAAGQSAEDQEQAFEGLAERTMDVEELKARRAELRMARELMFREEIRAKRIKKIKSKAYRRVHRKERDRKEAQQREALAAAGLLNSDDEREWQDRKRAEERMGARHRESRWAEGIKQAGRATWDEDARVGISDMANRDEELRRRQLGKDVTNPERSAIDSSSDTDYDSDTVDDNPNWAAQLKKVEAMGNPSSKSRLDQMAFMQRAEAVRKAENDEAIHQLHLALDGTDHVQDTEPEETDSAGGRQRFGPHTYSKAPPPPKPKVLRSEFEARLSSDEDEHVEKTDPVRQPATHMSDSTLPGNSKLAKRHHQIDATVSQPAIITSSPHRQSKQGQAQIPSAKRQSRTVETALDEISSSSGSDGDNEDDKHDVLSHDDAKAALAASIFAGPGDAAQEFAKEKAQLIREEDDQVIDNTLPGWGSWTGAGVGKREQKKGRGRFLTTLKGVAPEQRRDAKLDRVIVNEKRVKKNGKYLATELPYPFETRQQYERSLRLPIGPEWSTVNHYQDSIKPRVLLKQGTVVKPIATPAV